MRRRLRVILSRLKNNENENERKKIRVNTLAYETL